MHQQINDSVYLNIQPDQICLIQTTLVRDANPGITDQENANLAKASQSPANNEIFEPATTMKQNIPFNLEQASLIIRRAIENLQAALSNHGANGFPVHAGTNLETQIARALQAWKPNITAKPNGHIVYNPIYEYALITDSGYGPTYHGPYSTQEERESFVRWQFQEAKLSLQDTIFCLDFVDGRLEHIWKPAELWAVGQLENQNVQS